TETAIPSAFEVIAERSAFRVSPALPRGEPVQRVVQLTSAAASWAPNCVATSSGSSVLWLTKTNRQRGWSGKSPPPPPASAAGGASSPPAERPAAPTP